MCIRIQRLTAEVGEDAFFFCSAWYGAVVLEMKSDSRVGRRSPVLWSVRMYVCTAFGEVCGVAQDGVCQSSRDKRNGGGSGCMTV